MSLAEFDPHAWHPVRIPSGMAGMSASWSLRRKLSPRDDASEKADKQMTEWCEANCAAGWLPVPGEGGIVFWFEDDAEARAFALKWFPLRSW